MTAWMTWLWDGNPGATNSRWSQQELERCPTKVSYVQGA
jgi:hypothetical protein